MPTYEYQCKTCGHHFDRVQRFSDAPITECPECGEAVRRVIHPAGVIFKGSGWYITDSRKSGGDSATIGTTNGSKTEGSTATKGDGDAAKNESKPAEKSAATSES